MSLTAVSSGDRRHHVGNNGEDRGSEPQDSSDKDKSTEPMTTIPASVDETSSAAASRTGMEVQLEGNDGFASSRPVPLDGHIGRRQSAPELVATAAEIVTERVKAHFNNELQEASELDESRPSGVPTQEQNGARRSRRSTFVSEISEISQKVGDTLGTIEIDTLARDDVEVDTLTITLVATYYVSMLFQGRRQLTLTAIWWSCLSVVTVFAEISVLYALMIANNWWICKTQDDCNVGLACVHWMDGTTWTQLPYCIDCYYLVGLDTGYGYGDVPWDNRMVVQSSVSGIVNASEYCKEMIEAPEHLHYFVDNGFFPELLDANASDVLTYESCVYARAAGADQGFLDELIVQVAFMLLAVQVANDAAEHSTASSVRFKCLPWKIPGSRAGTAALLACKFMLNFLGMCFEKVVPALSGGAMIMLLITHGSGTTDVILNGLAVLFVLELDNLLGAAFLTCQEQTRIKKYASNVLSEHKAKSRSATKKRRGSTVQATKQKLRKMHLRKDRVVANSNTLCFCVFIALNLGFFRVTYAPHIPLPDSQRCRNCVTSC